MQDVPSQMVLSSARCDTALSHADVLVESGFAPISGPLFELLLDPGKSGRDENTWSGLVKSVWLGFRAARVENVLGNILAVDRTKRTLIRPYVQHLVHTVFIHILDLFALCARKA